MLAAGTGLSTEKDEHGAQHGGSHSLSTYCKLPGFRSHDASPWWILPREHPVASEQWIRVVKVDERWGCDKDRRSKGELGILGSFFEV